MTSWTRKRNKQHQELRTPKYRQRVVPVRKQEALRKAELSEFEKELEQMDETKPDT